MNICKHTQLVLLENKSKRLRCRHCHLTIKADELSDRYCPECYENSGIRRNDFEEVVSEETTRYRCETCHAIIEYVPQD